MELTELEIEALKLDPADRARLAEKLLASLETGRGRLPRSPGKPRVT